jgi:superfamily II DNA or RNA helicase
LFALPVSYHISSSVLIEVTKIRPVLEETICLSSMHIVPDDIANYQFLTPRIYQVRVLQAAILQNTLAFLPTGSGKTLIAVLLIRHFLHEDHSRENRRKIVAFIAPTKVLVDQQRSYIAGNCDAVVRGYTGLYSFLKQLLYIFTGKSSQL